MDNQRAYGRSAGFEAIGALLKDKSLARADIPREGGGRARVRTGS